MNGGWWQEEVLGGGRTGLSEDQVSLAALKSFLRLCTCLRYTLVVSWTFRFPVWPEGSWWRHFLCVPNIVGHVSYLAGPVPGDSKPGSGRVEGLNSSHRAVYLRVCTTLPSHQQVPSWFCGVGHSECIARSLGEGHPFALCLWVASPFTKCSIGRWLEF